MEIPAPSRVNQTSQGKSVNFTKFSSVGGGGGGGRRTPILKR